MSRADAKRALDALDGIVFRSSEMPEGSSRRARSADGARQARHQEAHRAQSGDRRGDHDRGHAGERRCPSTTVAKAKAALPSVQKARRRLRHQMDAARDSAARLGKRRTPSPTKVRSTRSAAMRMAVVPNASATTDHHRRMSRGGCRVYGDQIEHPEGQIIAATPRRVARDRALTDQRGAGHCRSAHVKKSRPSGNLIMRSLLTRPSTGNPDRAR